MRCHNLGPCIGLGSPYGWESKIWRYGLQWGTVPASHFQACLKWNSMKQSSCVTTWMNLLVGTRNANCLGPVAVVSINSSLLENYTSTDLTLLTFETEIASAWLTWCHGLMVWILFAAHMKATKSNRRHRRVKTRVPTFSAQIHVRRDMLASVTPHVLLVLWVQIKVVFFFAKGYCPLPWTWTMPPVFVNRWVIAG